MTTWLLVEDEPDLFDMLSTMIETVGHRVLGFSNGEEAAAWIQRVEAGQYGDELPELALLDIRLPGEIHGPDVAARLRQSEDLGRMVIVLMTAYRLSAVEETALLEYATPDMMLYKPLPKFPEFQRRLEDLLM